MYVLYSEINILIVCLNDSFNSFLIRMQFQMSSSEDEELFDVGDEVINEQRAIVESFENIEAESLKVAIELSHAEHLDKIKSSVTDKVNSIFGDELSNLCKVNQFQEELLGKLNDLDNKLDVANTETPSQLHESLRKGGWGGTYVTQKTDKTLMGGVTTMT